MAYLNKIYCRPYSMHYCHYNKCCCNGNSSDDNETTKCEIDYTQLATEIDKIINIDEIKTDIDSIDSTTNVIESNIKTLTEYYNQLKTSFESVSQKITQLENNVSNISSSIETLTDSFSNCCSQLNNKLDDLKEICDNIKCDGDNGNDNENLPRINSYPAIEYTETQSFICELKKNIDGNSDDNKFIANLSTNDNLTNINKLYKVYLKDENGSYLLCDDLDVPLLAEELLVSNDVYCKFENGKVIVFDTAIH